VTAEVATGLIVFQVKLILQELAPEDMLQEFELAFKVPDILAGGGVTAFVTVVVAQARSPVSDQSTFIARMQYR
jgi:hypothetical protein